MGVGGVGGVGGAGCTFGSHNTDSQLARAGSGCVHPEVALEAVENSAPLDAGSPHPYLAVCVRVADVDVVGTPCTTTHSNQCERGPGWVGVGRRQTESEGGRGRDEARETERERWTETDGLHSDIERVG